VPSLRLFHVSYTLKNDGVEADPVRQEVWAEDNAQAVKKAADIVVDILQNNADRYDGADISIQAD